MRTCIDVMIYYINIHEPHQDCWTFESQFSQELLFFCCCSLFLPLPNSLLWTLKLSYGLSDVRVFKKKQKTKLAAFGTSFSFVLRGRRMASTELGKIHREQVFILPSFSHKYIRRNVVKCSLGLIEFLVLLCLFIYFSVMPNDRLHEIARKHVDGSIIINTSVGPPIRALGEGPPVFRHLPPPPNRPWIPPFMIDSPMQLRSRCGVTTNGKGQKKKKNGTKSNITASLAIFPAERQSNEPAAQSEWLLMEIVWKWQIILRAGLKSKILWLHPWLLVKILSS